MQMVSKTLPRTSFLVAAAAALVSVISFGAWASRDVERGGGAAAAQSYTGAGPIQSPVLSFEAPDPIVFGEHTPIAVTNALEEISKQVGPIWVPQGGYVLSSASWVMRDDFGLTYRPARPGMPTLTLRHHRGVNNEALFSPPKYVETVSLNGEKVKVIRGVRVRRQGVGGPVEYFPQAATTVVLARPGWTIAARFDYGLQQRSSDDLARLDSELLGIVASLREYTLPVYENRP
ncbi:MAG: hypothetical protein HY681_13560 [Chloroflexi bacterium]|nr:hypothetical protein [Chloroflexota bacterium]